MAAYEPSGTVRSTRSAIRALLTEHPEGMTAAELADALGLHPNGIRRQAKILVREGEIAALRNASGRPGRPAVRYQLAGEQREAAAGRQLTRLLVELATGLGPSPEHVEEFGRRSAQNLARSSNGRDAVMDLCSAMGFSPQEITSVADAREGRLDMVLHRCAFADAVAAGGGDLVCTLHRGIARGLVERTPGARLTEFDVRPPHPAGCLIRAEGLPPVCAA